MTRSGGVGENASPSWHSGGHSLATSETLLVLVFMVSDASRRLPLSTIAIESAHLSELRKRAIMSLAYRQAGKGKASIRLAQAVSEFAAALDSPQRKATFKTLQTRSPPTAADVISFTEELNSDGTGLHRSWLPYGTRLVFVLDKIRLFTKAGDLLVGGSQNLIASGVWAVVRMSLQIATGFLTYFDKVSEVFMRIGMSSLIQQDLVSLFPDCQELHEFMAEYLILVVRFCHEIVSFTRKSFLSQLKSSLASSFDPECKTFETSIAVWSGLIDQRVQFLTAESQILSNKALAKTNRALELLSGSGARRAAFEERRFHVLRQLSPHQSRFDSHWRRQRKKGTTSWILKDPVYRTWKEPSPSSQLLWIRSKIGSGKTVLLANIVADLSKAVQSAESPLVASFFCQHGDPQTLQARCVLGSIICQWIKGLDDDIASRVMKTIKSAEDDPSALVSGLRSCLPASRNYFIVIDAIDDCPPEEASDIFDQLNVLDKSVNLRICLSSRSGSLADQGRMGELSMRPVYPQTASTDKDAEMASFIAREIERRKGSRSLDTQTVSLIQHALMLGSQGMYLWVVLQLDMLFPRYPRDLEQDLDITSLLDNLPEGLERSYDKAMERSTDRDTGRRAFQLVAAAARPLSLDELRVALNIEPENTDWNPSTLIRDSWRAVGGAGCGLIEINEEDLTVHFIHHSALQYVVVEEGSVKPPRSLAPFTLEEAELHLAWICVTYLSYPCFERQLTSNTGVTLEGTKATDTILKTALAQVGPPGRVFTHFMRHLPGKSQSVDIIKLMQEYQRSPPPTDDALLFAKYAKNYWLQHAKVFGGDVNTRGRHLFLGLLYSASNHVKSPVATMALLDVMKWALQSGHPGAFRVLMATDDDYPLVEWIHRRIIHTAVVRPVPLAGTEDWSLKGDGLGNLVARYISHAGRRGWPIEVSLETLLRYGADPNLSLDGKSPLCLVMNWKYESKRVVEILLSHGADAAPPVMDDSDANVFRIPMFMAIERRHPAYLEQSLSSGADANQRWSVDSALALMNPELLEAARNAGMPHRDFRIITPLLRCALLRFYSGMGLLLENGADPNVALINGLLPLHIALWVGDIPMVKLLVANGADPSIEGIGGFVAGRGYVPGLDAPFLIAVKTGNGEMVDVLSPALKEGGITRRMPISSMHALCDTLRSNRISGLDGKIKRGFSNVMKTLVSKGASTADIDDLPAVITHLSSDAVVAFMTAGALPKTGYLKGCLPYELLEKAIERTCTDRLSDKYIMGFGIMATRLCLSYYTPGLRRGLAALFRAVDDYQVGGPRAMTWLAQLVESESLRHATRSIDDAPAWINHFIPGHYLSDAIRCRWVDAVKFLVNTGLKIDALANSPSTNHLLVAIESGSLEIFQILWSAWKKTTRPDDILVERVRASVQLYWKSRTWPHLQPGFRSEVQWIMVAAR